MNVKNTLNIINLGFAIGVSLLACGPIARELMPRPRSSDSDPVQPISRWSTAEEAGQRGATRADRQLEAVINEIRSLYKLQPVTFDSELSLVARSHSKYLDHNAVTSIARWHSQSPKATFFTGATLANRLGHFGAGKHRAYVLEGVLRHSDNYLESIEANAKNDGQLRQSRFLVEQMLGSPKHRSVVLAPSNRRFGVGRSGPFRVLLAYAPRFTDLGHGGNEREQNSAIPEAVGFPLCGFRSDAKSNASSREEGYPPVWSEGCQKTPIGKLPQFSVHLSKRLMGQKGLSITVQAVNGEGRLEKVAGRTERGEFGTGRLGPTDLLFVPKDAPSSSLAGPMQITLTDSRSGRVLLEWRHQIK